MIVDAGRLLSNRGGREPFIRAFRAIKPYEPMGGLVTLPGSFSGYFWVVKGTAALITLTGRYLKVDRYTSRHGVSFMIIFHIQVAIIKK